MNDEDKRVIARFATDGTRRVDAIEAYRRNLRTMPDQERYASDHMNFMREIDTEVPDHWLRARYRNAIKEQ